MRIHLCIFLLFERTPGKKASSSDIRREAGVSPFLERNIAKKREVSLRYGGEKSGRIDRAFDEERRRAEQYRLFFVVRFA